MLPFECSIKSLHTITLQFFKMQTLFGNFVLEVKLENFIFLFPFRSVKLTNTFFYFLISIALLKEKKILSIFLSFFFFCQFFLLNFIYLNGEFATFISKFVSQPSTIPLIRKHLHYYQLWKRQCVSIVSIFSSLIVSQLWFCLKVI